MWDWLQDRRVWVTMTSKSGNGIEIDMILIWVRMQGRVEGAEVSEGGRWKGVGYKKREKRKEVGCNKEWIGMDWIV